METTVRRIAGELGVGEDQIEVVLRLLSEGSTVPFLARYRKEATGGLDLAQLRAIEERLQQVRELDERRGFILKAVAEQGRLTPELQTAVSVADSRARLEDLYLPFKQKRRSRANQARDPRPRAAGRPPPLEPAAVDRGRSRALRESRDGRDRSRGGARRRPLDPARTLLGRPEAARGAAPVRLRARAAAGQGHRGTAGEGRQVRRVLRLQRAGARGAVAPRAGAVPRPQGRRAAARPGAADPSGGRPRAGRIIAGPGQGRRGPAGGGSRRGRAAAGPGGAERPRTDDRRAVRDQGRGTRFGRLAARRRAPRVEDEGPALRAGRD